MTTTELRAAFRQLHRPGAPLILPNIWDAGSAGKALSFGHSSGTENPVIGRRLLADPDFRRDMAKQHILVDTRDRRRRGQAALAHPLTVQATIGRGLADRGQW